MLFVNIVFFNNVNFNGWGCFWIYIGRLGLLMIIELLNSLFKEL